MAARGSRAWKEKACADEGRKGMASGMSEWMYEFLDAVICRRMDEALRIAYQNEGEQLSLF